MSLGRSGTSFIDLILSIGILALLFGGIFTVYFSLLDSVNSIELRTAAAALLEERVEIVRNLPYDNVGTVGGIPAGILAQQNSITYGKNTFVIATTIRNIDDPFDGTLGGAPNDTAPADYKLMTMTISCTTCAKFVPLSFTTTIAPKNLESAGKNGSLFVNALDASGGDVGGASVRIVNASVTPSIDLTDATNASGVLQLVGVATSTQSYQITITKAGYSSEKTYTIGDPANPNPTKPHATVGEQTVTNITFLIDRLSSLAVEATDAQCGPIPGVSFTLSGAKLVGTSPDVLKFSTSSATNVSGTKTFGSLEWDTYALLMTSSSQNVIGTTPFSPLVINPSSSQSFKFMLAPANPSALLVTVADAQGGAGVPSATIAVAGAGSKMAGRAFSGRTDWSGGQYASQDGSIETDAVAGELTLKLTASSTYPTSTTSWLISNTIDLGGSSSTLHSFSWNPTSQPGPTGPDSATFQVAANNDLSTWNFIGPDGTASSFFTASSSLPAALQGKRYIRYKALMKTGDEYTTPRVTDTSLQFSGPCVPPYQAIFAGLGAGSYDVSAKAPGYGEATTTASLSGNFLEVKLELPAP